MIDKEILDKMARETVDGLKKDIGDLGKRAKEESRDGKPVGCRVNKVIYFLLAFFFGSMGIHKFYAGHILSGIFFLAFFTVGFLFTFIFGLGYFILVPLEFIALVQGIIGLCKETGPDGLAEL